jgi:hypothetical protein
MNADILASRDRLLAAWPDLDPRDRALILSILGALATWAEAKAAPRPDPAA